LSGEPRLLGGRNELEASARLLGTKVHSEKPQAFAARAQAYFEAWRTEVKNDPIIAE
jgi:hypothetical protein